MGQEIDGGYLGDDYKGYTFKITGGNDAQGFAMKQGIMKNGRSRILFKKSKCDTNLSSGWTANRGASGAFTPINSNFLISLFALFNNTKS